MKQIFFSIDDVIRVFQELALHRPVSLFDHPFLGMLQRMHKKWGLKAQLNLFFFADPAWPGGAFALSDMPACYREEFRAAAPWLRLAFHADREFPEYPFIHIGYEEMKAAYTRMQREICRFAGEECLSPRLLLHYNAVSQAGCRALKDCGVRLLSSTCGPEPLTGESALSPAFLMRLHACQREETTRAYMKTRSGGDIIPAIRAYNHLSPEENARCDHSALASSANALGLPMKEFCHFLLNAHAPKEIEALLPARLQGEFIGIGNHEQYFYPDYPHYQPDYEKRIETICRMLRERDWQFIRMDELGPA